MTNETQSDQAENTFRKKELIIGIGVVLGVIALIAAIVLVFQNNTPKIDFPPTVACNIFTEQKAKKLLGEQAFNSNSGDPIISGNSATSKCGYTDGNSDTTKVVVAAINLRAGINAKGVGQNQSEFNNGKPRNGVEDVNNLGDAAYYNQVLGQLNVLDGNNWIIFSYGLGSAPESNTLGDATKFARLILETN